MSANQFVSITTTPSEDATAIRELVAAHFREIFDQRDSQVRILAMKRLYHEDVVWYKPDEKKGADVVKGIEALNAEIGREMETYPEFRLVPDGHLSISQNHVAVHWDLGPPAMPDLIKAAHYFIVEGGKVKILWTAHFKMPGQGSN